MEKRSCERIDANIEVRFSYGYIFYNGIIVNMSQRGLFIRTKNRLPDNSVLLIFFRLGNDLLKLLARVKHLEKSNKKYEGMGIELLNPQKEYFQFLESMKPTCNF